jgi:hypothetical protein
LCGELTQLLGDLGGVFADADFGDAVRLLAELQPNLIRPCFCGCVIPMASSCMIAYFGAELPVIRHEKTLPLRRF